MAPRLLALENARLRPVAAALLVLAGIHDATPAVAQPFDLQGHRGARGLAPENSLPAFARALSIGVTTLELDLVVTADDRLVVLHDMILDPAKTRGPDGSWIGQPGPPVRSLTLAALRRFDVGRLDPASRYGRQWPEQEPSDGTPVPTLAEVVALTRARGAEAIRFNVETKITPDRPELGPAPERFAELLLAELRTLRIVDRTTVQSFDWRTLAALRALEPALDTACLTARRDWLDNVGHRSGAWTAGLRLTEHGGSVPTLVAAAGCRSWSPYFEDLTDEDLDRARKLGLAVVPWTVNAPVTMRHLLNAGVQGLITDYPDRLRAVMTEHGLPLPKANP